MTGFTFTYRPAQRQWTMAAALFGLCLILVATTGRAAPTDLEAQKLDRARAATQGAAVETAPLFAPAVVGTPSDGTPVFSGRGTSPATLEDWPSHLGTRPVARSIPAALIDQVRRESTSRMDGEGLPHSAFCDAQSVREEQAEIERKRAARLGDSNLRTGPRSGSGSDSESGIDIGINEFDNGLAMMGTGANLDDDAAHYARGSTLVLHVFVNHTQGTWNTSEMDESGARAALAKEFWLNRVPVSPSGESLPNLHFDYEGLDGYWSVTATLNSAIPDSGMGSATMEAALAALGASDLDGDSWIVDDYSLALQNAFGGWDNVLLVFQPADVVGRAWASYSFSRTALYPNSGWAVWAHEWGHLFGACDEYVEDNTCNNGLDCGTCQGTYQANPTPNFNCDLSCGNPGDLCLMKANDFVLCSFTRNHVAWRDSNIDGKLDDTRRRVFMEVFAPSVELLSGEPVLSSELVSTWVAPARHPNWTVVGLRNPPGSVHELELYGENNLNHLYATSNAGNQVELLVCDYNHMPPENDYILVDKIAGSGSYRLQFESGTEEVYADGVTRTSNWGTGDVARVFELPLFAGEPLSFVLDPSSGLDLGMALFRSNGTTFRGNRSNAEWIRDGGTGGAVESVSYLVPEDDVYGLVLWSNGADTGTATLKIGPTTFPLTDDQTVETTASLGLYQYTPGVSAWSFVGARPAAPGGDVTLRLFDDSSFTSELEESSGSGGLEFIVADYNHAPWQPEYVRSFVSGGVGQQVEWEHGYDLLGGRAVGSWEHEDLGKVWDIFLKAGSTYFFRTYEAGGLRGLHLFYSGDGDHFKSRSDALASSVSRPPSENGEWFSFSPIVNDRFGLVMSSELEAASSYQLWFGPKTVWNDNTPAVFTDEVTWGTHLSISAGAWAAAGCRSEGGDASMTLYADEGYGQQEANDQGTEVPFVVMDYNHESFDWQYLRARNAADGFLTVEFDSGQGSFLFVPGGQIIQERDWPFDGVVEVFDLPLPGSRSNPQDIRIELDALSGGLDLGMALFRSNDGPYKASRGDAVAIANPNGPRLSESIEFTSVDEDVYGLVIWNRSGTTGTYQLSIYDPAVTDVSEDNDTELDNTPQDLDVRLLTENPFGHEVRWEIASPDEAPLQAALFDAAGRLVRTLDRGRVASGRSEIRWDGLDDSQRAVGPGVYFARFRIGNDERISKVVKR